MCYACVYKSSASVFKLPDHPATVYLLHATLLSDHHHLISSLCVYVLSNYWQQNVRQLCNFALRPLSFNIITVCVLSKNVRQLCFTHARIGYCRVRCVGQSTTGHHCSCWVQCRCGKLLITGRRNSDNISWMPARHPEGTMHISCRI